MEVGVVIFEIIKLYWLPAFPALETQQRWTKLQQKPDQELMQSDHIKNSAILLVAGVGVDAAR